jgi:hypothetical protein
LTINTKNSPEDFEATLISGLKLNRSLHYLQMGFTILSWAAIVVAILFKLLGTHHQLVTPLALFGGICGLISWGIGLLAKPLKSKTELIRKAIETRLKEVNGKK